VVIVVATWTAISLDRPVERWRGEASSGSLPAYVLGEVGAVLASKHPASPATAEIGTISSNCGLVAARIIDLDGVYDPCRPNDRLLPGMKGSTSEFELGVLRFQMLECAPVRIADTGACPSRICACFHATC
jgi:hypothetical protein